MTSDLEVRVAEPADAAELLQVIRAAFSARRPVDPPAEALTDAVADIEHALTVGSGVVLVNDGHLVAGLLIELDGDVATLRRVSVLPAWAGKGLARMLVQSALTLAVDLGARRVELVARQEFPEIVQWWRDHGFEVLGGVPNGHTMGRDLPVIIDVPTAEDMRSLGRRLAGLLRKGDVIVATGDLGAGKTTLTQGIGEGLGVTGPIISPTFVISRVHPHPGEGPALVHVDAYRLGGSAEFADIDLDASLSEAVTIVEWGSGLAEWLADSRLEIDIERGLNSDQRTVHLTGIGPRWAGALEPLREQL
ncbi:tRNA (adenosine(37)-N6)-threonylcarbamoyltransferase complex ATPase subunit type 1 TsaE [Tessaracoccus sp. MC1865]|uniref:tRNA (adenosine(37)-N6)-threonylcarbamoyltransferase complex ATPase subunit type 1 TsaE n=1 Tax=Tessaracoccus sp. MC1865 TaxID=2760310 RepID=UPI0016022FAE|nr:tRNA (adenosine(37)-N6)-threonylcarbamoyltransferase complex ATPase subunit type 1 TsaE [Tessaracoccus sp. MC1865]MBB1482266.1 tRNA (adenosine(37)-N6)-threonylcarbamoyltransferase complex ATPase subunit type 1 TsaE [Tessaracoccus sp. MC1865]QTO38262.1 tRNA (adenosine(37)-N6)-threonylcarbamoyltransferase complex ATPase subunit type 1 TsaE [Tessaracoccus sp. MC1865]